VQLWFLTCKSYGTSFLLTQIVTFIKDEGSNLQTYANALISITSCNNLGLLEPFDGSCLGHVLSKVCQYATIDEKYYVGLSCTSIKSFSI